MAQPYIKTILEKSSPYLKTIFTDDQLCELVEKTLYLTDEKNIQKVVDAWSAIYIDFVKRDYQRRYKDTDKQLDEFITYKDDGVKIIWGGCLDVLKAMKPESIHLMVTSPPYYNARDYSHWSNLSDYLEEMRAVIREAYRVLDNNRVFLWNVGDIYDNDNLFTKSVWGKRRIPLGAYFIKIFEEERFTFVDDYIWDKGEVQSERQKNGDKPYPFYQYPMNCYEHILIFHKHRNDDIRYPCPLCGCLQVNGNAFTEIGLRSWECKNRDCFRRSAADRGKRFSLKTIMTQGRQSKEAAIDNSFIKRYRRDIIKINPVIKINSKGKNKLGHSAPFPLEIPEMAVRFFSYPEEIVLDPFGGSMTSVIAAQQNNRVGVGIELNKDMFLNSVRENLKNRIKGDVMISEFDYDWSCLELEQR
ncbi:MAG: site-specific DNA-methyltransferase [Deferribacteraceae bacterium]|jgi:DNA modification methylase|nr:site-specific DNA-methyltransferase [Deferribacteraceae bacterium]